ncbi:MAG: hypothetical protein Tsb002_27750 [Wenzhouxiangellaceae bacterium]
MKAIEIFFATNREHKTENGELKFTNNVLPPVTAGAFRVGRAVVHRDNGKYRLHEVELFSERMIRSSDAAETVLERDDLPPEVKVRAARQTALDEASGRVKLGSNQLLEIVQQQMTDEQCDALIFVHGFSNTFEMCLERAAELKDKYQSNEVKEMVTFVFSWPSDGRTFPPLEYFDDRQDAELSGRALARALCRLIEFVRASGKRGQLCRQRLHLVCHSMGNWALRSAVQALVNDYLKVQSLPIFEHVFLMAADEDDDALEKSYKLAPLTRFSQAIHVYHNKNDIALDISDITKGNPDRLGKHGPKNMTMTGDRIVAIDCHKVDSSGVGDGNHQYYYKRHEVIDDVVQVLAGKAPDEIAGREGVNNHPRRFRIKKRGV